MDPITIISLLAQFAPSIVRAVGAGGSAQKIANTAAAVATAVTGKADLGEAATALAADPSLVLQYQTKLLEQESANEKLYFDDKRDARARDIAISSTPMGNVRANWLAIAAFAIIAGCLGIVVLKADLGEYVQSTISLILGMFIRELGNIYAFEFGTTRRSREQTDKTIEDLKSIGANND